jgi:hypothetical protein
MARGAAFTHGCMLKNEGPGLLAVALRAVLVPAGHGQPASRLHNIQAMWIMALDAIHFPFVDRMMLRQVKGSIDVQMALVTRLRVLPGIDDELVPARPADGNMLAAGPVTGFAPGLPSHFAILQMQPRVGT